MHIIKLYDSGRDDWELSKPGKREVITVATDFVDDTGHAMVLRMWERREWYYVQLGIPGQRFNAVAEVALAKPRVLTHDYMYRKIMTSWANAGITTLEPHAYVVRKWRKRGIVSAIYKWVMDSGIVLVSSEAHTMAARKVWRSLGNNGYTLNAFNTWNGRQVSLNSISKYENRMILYRNSN